MIQRIQTLYMLAAFILNVVLFYIPYANLTSAKGLFYLSGIGFFDEVSGETIDTTILTIILLFVIMVLIFYSILKYTKRKLQKKLNLYSIILCCVYLAFQISYIKYYSVQYNAFVNYCIPGIFPAISIILLLLANYYISKDEELIRSTERLR